MLLARTGYTGEDGFEIFARPEDAEALWAALTAAGAADGLVPAGLAARDTLRLEAGMPLYGNELGPDLTPFDAGLGRVVKLDKPGDFVGRAALAKRAGPSPQRELVGLAVQSRRVPRHGYSVLWDGAVSGHGDQRRAVPDPRRADRDGLRRRRGGAPGRRPGRTGARQAGRRHPGQRRACHTGAAAVLPPPGLTGRPQLIRRGERRHDRVPEELHYTPEHEWVAISGSTASVGITDHAQRALGDVVYVSAPAAGTKVTAGEPCGEVESTKSVSDLYSPVDGEVTEVNAEIDDDPGPGQLRPLRGGLAVQGQPGRRPRASSRPACSRRPSTPR